MPEWYEDTFIVAPLIVIGSFIALTIGGVIIGVTIARYILKRFDD